MRIKHKNLILLIFILEILCCNIYAHFEDVGCGARAAGLGNAYTAEAAGPELLYYNPAGLAYNQIGQFTSAYSRLSLGLTDGSNLGRGFIGVIVPLGDKWGLGMGWQSFYLTSYYSENTFYLSFASRLSKKFAIGSSIKVLYKKYGSTPYTESSVNLITAEVENIVNPVFKDGYSKIGYTPDIGAIYEINQSNRVGLMVKNILVPDMSLSSDDTDVVPLTAKLGYRYKRNNFKSLLDFSYSEEKFSVFSGAENWFMDNLLALRGGIGIGSGEYRNLAVGASVKHYDTFRLDYAFNYPLEGIKNIYGTHKVELTASFGKKIISEKEINESRELFDLGKNAYEDNNYKAAEKYFTKAYEMNIDFDEAKEMYQMSRYKRKTKVKIIKFTSKTYAEGNKALQKEDFGSAIAKFTEIVEMDDMGWIEMKKLIRKALDKLSDFKREKDEYVKKLVKRAANFYLNTEYGNAYKELKKATKLDPSNRDIKGKSIKVEKKLMGEYYMSGIGYYLEEEYEKSLEEFMKIISIKGNHPQAIEMIDKIKKEKK